MPEGIQRFKTETTTRETNGETMSKAPDSNFNEGSPEETGPTSTSSGSSSHAGGTRPGQTRKKPKDLSVRECEECGCLCCHTHLDMSVSRTWSDSDSEGCDNRYTYVHV